MAPWNVALSSRNPARWRDRFVLNDISLGLEFESHWNHIYWKKYVICIYWVISVLRVIINRKFIGHKENNWLGIPKQSIKWRAFLTFSWKCFPLLISIFYSHFLSSLYKFYSDIFRMSIRVNFLGEPITFPCFFRKSALFSFEEALEKSAIKW